MWLNKSKILINTSSSEGFPNSFIHAWFLNVLVISFLFDPDYILKNENIGYCANGDYNKFTKMIQEQINNNETHNICNRAAIFANKHFDLNKNLNKFIHLIQPNC